MAAIVVPKVTLVRAREERDFDTVLRVQRVSKSKVYAAYVEEDDLRYLFREGNISLIKAGKELVGLVASLPDKEAGNLAENTNLAILPKYKGNGFGTEAWSLNLKELKRQGFEEVWWVVHPGNKHSRSIVEPGSEYVGRVADYYGDGEPRLIFEKRL